LKREQALGVVSMPSVARRKPEASTKAPLKKAQVTVSGIAINILDSWSHIRVKQPSSVRTEAYNVNVKVA